MDDDQRDDITEEREEVAEESTPETNTEAVEQRTDDYDGIVRRLDDIDSYLRERLDGMQRALEALGVSVVESDVDIDTIGETAGEVVDEILGIDGLDLL